MDNKPLSREVLVAMRDTLAHRGPDDQGIYIDGALGLGHQRLSVIDLSSAAHQPMLSDDGRIVIVYNGEIYNFRELRDDLKKEGWIFRSRSDTEVLIAGYAVWGIRELVTRLDGMAAFALWDSEERLLYLVRDRYGTKPLYIWKTNSTFAFSSEIKAFLKHPEFSVRVNESALREYFTFQNLFRQHTLFKDVESLPPASILTLDGEHIRTEAFWNYDFSKPEDISITESTEELEQLMMGAVERQLVADVPIGGYLSGGMDSGSIIALASRSIPRMKTFTAGFELSSVTGTEASFDERDAAELMAHTFKTEHYEQVINAGDIRWSLPRVVWHLEDLRLGMSYPNYYIARLASKFVKVCLSGAGGDELFGGYPWRYYRVLHSLNEDDFLENYFEFWQRLTSLEQRQKLFKGAKEDHMEMFNVFSNTFADATNGSFDTPEQQIEASLYFECRTFLSSLLLIGDKLAMASGLEERFPFLDNKLVDFAMHLPVRHKLANIESSLHIDERELKKKMLAHIKSSSGKTCLRKAMSNLIPNEVMMRPKQGFSSPEASWYRGENADYVQEMLLAESLASEDYINPDFIKDVVRDHLSGDANHRLLIWSLLSFEQWCRIFINNEDAYA